MDSMDRSELYDDAEDMPTLTDSLDEDSLLEILQRGIHPHEGIINLLAQDTDEVKLKRLINTYVQYCVSNGTTNNKNEFTKVVKADIIRARATLLGGQSRVYSDVDGIYMDRIDKPGRTKLANFRVIERKILSDTNGGQTVLWVIEYIDPSTENMTRAEVILTGAHMTKAKDLQSKIAERFIDAMVGQGANDLRILLDFVNNKANVPVTSVISKDHYGFHEWDGVPFLLHAERKNTQYGTKLISKIMLPDGTNLPSEVEYNGSGTRGIYTIPDLDKEVALNWTKKAVKHYTNMTNPIKAKTILGWTMASFIREQISRQIIECRLPILFVYGNREVGKSVLITSLMKAFGWSGLQGKGGEIGLRQTTPSQIRDILTSYANLPIILGEYRISNPNSELITQTILMSYDGMGTTKKGARTMSGFESVEQTYRAPMVIIGNDMVQDEAARSRILLMHMETKDREGTDCSSHMLEMQKIPEGSVGAGVFQWILNNWDRMPDIIDEGYELVQGLGKDIEARSLATIRCVTIGLKMLQKYCGMISDQEMIEVANYLQGTLKANRADTLAAKFIEFLADRHSNRPNALVDRSKTDGFIAFDVDWLSWFRDYLIKSGDTNVPTIKVIRESIQSDTEALTFGFQIRSANNGPERSGNKRRIKLDIAKVEEQFGIPVDVWGTEDPLII